MAEASPLERQSPRVASCLTHGLCPGQPGLQTAAVVPMGSADHRFCLAEILSQSYSVREGSSEAACGPEQPEEELDKHFGSQRSNMPLEELLALYGYEVSDPISDRDSEGSEATTHLPDMTLDKEPMAKDLLAGEEEPQPTATYHNPAATSREAPDLFPAQSGACILVEAGVDRERPSSSSSSSDADEDPLPANKCKKEIMVGPQFQADLSTLHLQRQGEKMYENEDQLLWDPNVLPEREVEEFLYRAMKRRWHDTAESQVPEGETVKDSEQALYELVKCRFNAEEALRRLRFNVKVIREGMCAWSEEECRNFEHGFRVHGKNFHLIQANKVRTRSVGECVEYYYLWKKSERYDYFTQQTRLGRRKYGPSGTTDTDQDLDTAESEGPGRPRSSPPLPPGTDSPELEPLAQMHLELPGVHSGPSVGSSGLPSLEHGPCPCPLPAAPPAEPVSQRPPEAFCPPAVATPEPSPSPSMAVDLAVPGALPEDMSLLSGHADLSGGAAPAVAPAQVALSVTDLGLLGIGDVNPFLTAHPACPAPGLHSEPLSQ